MHQPPIPVAQDAEVGVAVPDFAADRPPPEVAPVARRIDFIDPSPRFSSASTRVRIWLISSITLALILPVAVSLGRGFQVLATDLLIALALVVASVCNVELSRVLDRAAREQQRPHKGLSAWAIATVILLPSWYLLPVLALTYTHAWLRDRHLPKWKWIGAASYMSLASLTSSLFLGVAPFEISLVSGNTGGALAMVVASCCVVMVVESVLLSIFVVLNGANREIWLRRTLTDPLFYATEFGVLTLGAMTGLVAEVGGWFVLLLGPSFLLMQQAVLHRPLQERADYDAKTGVLQFRSWQRSAQDLVAGQVLEHRPWAVLFADLDRFHAFNENYGHLGGDQALAVIAKVMRDSVGARGIVGRFGGEEFCALLTDVSVASALEAAEKIRTEVATLGPPDLPESITVSLGVAAVPGFRTEITVSEAISYADEALYRAKQSGRNASRVARLS